MNTTIGWKEKNIIRLDDHQLVLDGFTEWCQQEYPEIKLRNYKDPDEVFSLIVSSLFKDEKIDLFITDFAHSGLNGYEMCKAIRAIERALNRLPMPILLLTLYGNDIPDITDGLAKGVFTRYLSLGAGPEDTVRCIEEMIRS
ncbi:MAG TPA: response regulator [Chitinophagaceae bacterium]|nr:response regulator [Chitinophagaceae bacterium]